MVNFGKDQRDSNLNSFRNHEKVKIILNQSKIIILRFEHSYFGDFSGQAASDFIDGKVVLKEEYSVDQCYLDLT